MGAFGELETFRFLPFPIRTLHSNLCNVNAPSTVSIQQCAAAGLTLADAHTKAAAFQTS